MPFVRIYLNSVLIALVVTVGQLATCTLAAFAFSRLNFRGRDALFALPAPFVHLFDVAGTTVGANDDWRAPYLT